MQRKNPFLEGEIYHIFNRGVEKRDIFNSTKDYERFIENLINFNNEEPAQNKYYRDKQSNDQNSYEVGPRKNSDKKLVEIIAYCLLPNHYHLLIKETREGGITEFMRKMGTGYTMYFNKKNERVGPLFQGKFKSTLIENEPQFFYIPQYIHLNALDLISPETTTGSKTQELVDFVENYRWSSAHFFTKEKHDDVISPLLVKELYGPKDDRTNALRELIRSEDFLRGRTS